MKSSLLLLLLLAGFSLLSAQTSDSLPAPELRLQARYFQGNILLRWGPIHPAAWVEGNQYGYQLSRQRIQAGSPPRPDGFEALNPEAIKALSLEEFEAAAMAAPDNRYLKVVAACIYRDPAEQQDLTADWLRQSDQLSNRYGFALFAAEMDFEAAAAAGLGWQDQAIEEGASYLYRLVRLGENGPVGVPVFSRVVAAPSEPLLPHLMAPSEEENRVVLHWSRTAYERHFSAYWIEKSSDSLHWDRLNELPYVHGMGQETRVQTELISYVDSVVNYEPAWYRIRGIDPFGIASPASEAQQAMGRDRQAPEAVQDLQASTTKEGNMILNWSWEGEAEDLVGFLIRRGFDYQGPRAQLTETLLPPDTRRYLDSQPNYVGINYYEVVAVDTAGNERISRAVPGFVEDHEPPVAPVGLQAVVDSLGRVELSWPRHPAPDVKGFKVFFANSLGEHFTSLTQRAVADTFFRDTLSLRSLTEQAYYRLVAVDARGNVSAFSEPLAVARPDLIPPAKALFRDYSLNGGKVALTWSPSESRDVERQVLMRKAKGEEWRTLAPLYPGQGNWTDSLVQAHTTYAYRVDTYDDAGLLASSAPLQVRTSRTALEVKLEVQPNRQGPGVQLHWQASRGGVGKWILYRAEAEEPLQRMATLPGEQTKLEDVALKADVNYRYALRPMFRDGAPGPLGQEVIGKWTRNK